MSIYYEMFWISFKDFSFAKGLITKFCQQNSRAISEVNTVIIFVPESIIQSVSKTVF